MRTETPVNTSQPPVPVAFVANLDPGSAIHARSFRQAIQDALAFHPDLAKRVQPRWYNDQANKQGGQRASLIAVRDGCKYIVGHFASAAAEAALPAYQPDQIPVFLPAATADQLTQGKGPVFRLCRPDRHLASTLLTHAKENGVNQLLISGDGSAHAQHLQNALQTVKKPCSSFQVTTGLQNQQFEHIDLSETNLFTPDTAICFIGSYENSIRFLKQLSWNEREPQNQTLIYLADDAVHPDIAYQAPPLLRPFIRIIGFAPSQDIFIKQEPVHHYKKRSGKYPGTYYAETFCATELVLHLAAQGNRNQPLAQKLVPTCLGQKQLNKPELSTAPYACWHIKDQTIQPDILDTSTLTDFSHPLPSDVKSRYAITINKEGIL